MDDVLRKRVVRVLLAAAVLLPTVLLLAYLINPFAAQSLDPRERILGLGLYRNASESMLPTLQLDEVVLVRAGYYHANPPQRGELVVLRVTLDGRQQRWLKRVVALPGEQVEIRNGKVHIDGRILAEPYVAPDNRHSGYSRHMGAVTVAQGHYFLLGDNRDNSHDSRLLGSIARQDLLARVIQPDTD